MGPDLVDGHDIEAANSAAHHGRVVGAVPVVALLGRAQLPIHVSAPPRVRMSLATRAVAAGIYRAVGTQGVLAVARPVTAMDGSCGACTRTVYAPP